MFVWPRRISLVVLYEQVGRGGRPSHAPRQGRRLRPASREVLQRHVRRSCSSRASPCSSAARIASSHRRPRSPETLGVSEVVIGLTIVAGGTSAPELATSLIAVFAGQDGPRRREHSWILRLQHPGNPRDHRDRRPDPDSRRGFPVRPPGDDRCLGRLFPDSARRATASAGVEGGLLTSAFVIYTVLLFVGWPFPADRGTAAPEGEATSTLRDIHHDQHIDLVTPESHRG